MLITSGDSIMGTVFDDIGQAALRLKLGDCISFGSFVPEAVPSDMEIRLPMLWHVIDRKENRLKLLSCFFFEHTGYWSVKGDKTEVTWRDTEIRKDLNDRFYYKCFTENERSAILTTEVKTETAEGMCVITNDKLFVPSYEDIVNIPDHLKIGRGLYFDRCGDDAPSVKPMYCFYWLRDPGTEKAANLIVRGCSEHEIVLDSLDCYSDEVGVRAVMWVDAEKMNK